MGRDRVMPANDSESDTQKSVARGGKASTSGGRTTIRFRTNLKNMINYKVGVFHCFVADS